MAQEATRQQSWCVPVTPHEGLFHVHTLPSTIRAIAARVEYIDRLDNISFHSFFFSKDHVKTECA